MMKNRDVSRYLVAGELSAGNDTREIKSPFDGSTVGMAAVADSADVTRAIDAAAGAAPTAGGMPSHQRADVLREIRGGLEERKDWFAELLAAEAGKPLKAARLEIDRSLFVLRLAAEEATRIGGELLPLDQIPAGEGRWGITRRFPLAPISAITPFNFPVLLALHKLAPAIACGATIVLKPPPQDPLTTLALGELISESGYPSGGVNIVPCTVEDAAPLLDDPRVKMVSFTGSAKAGWAIKGKAVKKKVALELGGNAGVIVERDADISYAADRCVLGGYAYSGQSCISVQRILVHADVYDAFVEKLTEKVGALKCGDPLDEATDVGPMIDEDNAKRAEAWIQEAVSDGARLTVGGEREGSIVNPAVMVDTKPDMKVNCEEVFAPVTTVTAFDDFADALLQVNDSPYGLQAGVFTHDQRKIWRAYEELEVGGVISNDISTFRVDSMPYGGVKESGQGREGVRFAIREMTEMRLLILS